VCNRQSNDLSIDVADVVSNDIIPLHFAYNVPDRVPDSVSNIDSNNHSDKLSNTVPIKLPNAIPNSFPDNSTNKLSL
jgi:hypothetical protein